MGFGSASSTSKPNSPESYDRRPVAMIIQDERGGESGDKVRQRRISTWKYFSIEIPQESEDGNASENVFIFYGNRKL